MMTDNHHSIFTLLSFNQQFKTQRYSIQNKIKRIKAKLLRFKKLVFGIFCLECDSLIN